VTKVIVSGTVNHNGKKFNRTFSNVRLAESWIDKFSNKVAVHEVKDVEVDGLADNETDLVEVDPDTTEERYNPYKPASSKTNYLLKFPLTDGQTKKGTSPYIIVRPGIVMKIGHHTRFTINRLPIVKTLKSDPDRGIHVGSRLSWDIVFEWDGDLKKNITALEHDIKTHEFDSGRSAPAAGHMSRPTEIEDHRPSNLRSLKRALQIVQSGEFHSDLPATEFTSGVAPTENKIVGELAYLTRLDAKTLGEKFMRRHPNASLTEMRRSDIITDILIAAHGHTAIKEAIDAGILSLIEVAPVGPRTKMPNWLVSELRATEVDTLDDDSPTGKKALVDDLNRAEPIKGGIALRLSDESLDYLISNSMPNIIDIAQSNENRRLEGLTKRFLAKLNTK
jgi:hypothetical protein